MQGFRKKSKTSNSIAINKLDFKNIFQTISFNINTITTHAQMISKEFNFKSNALGKQCIPYRFNILKTSGFGKSDSDHSFTSGACFEHILLHPLKSNYLSPQDNKTILRCHPLFKYLNQMLTWSKTDDFSTLPHIFYFIYLVVF